MKFFKKSMLLILIITTAFFLSIINVQAVDLIEIPRMDGGYIKYRNTDTLVKMPSEYIEQESDFRAVWISHLVSDIAAYSNEEQYKSEMNRIFTIMEYYHINAMIYHVRINNDALYKSRLNPVASYFRNVDFNTFDPLTYTIEEAHRRGIEFHAWMNPYRIAQNTVYPDYNIASIPGYTLEGKILNPGEPAVRDFLVDTVMELVENYDIDAVHFDDYFYINCDDSATRAKYNVDNLSIEDFRRQQIDLFIENLSTTLHEYNQSNNRVVQLGISPSGIYQNGSYVPLENYVYDANGSLTYPLGSNTAGYSHYGSPLYSDTKKWIDKEWIDYILPQSYWGLEHSVAGYADIMDWWNMAVANKNVNLYSGMGLYMVNEQGGSSWNTNPIEGANQVQYASKLANVKGHSIYSFKHLASAFNQKYGNIYQNMETIKNKMWVKDSILPEIRTYDMVLLDSVKNLALSKTSVGYRIDFDEIEDAKGYAIYRSSSPLTFSKSELIEVLGDDAIDNKVSFIDQVNTQNNYYYGVKPISKTNSLGLSSTLSTDFSSDNGNLLSLDKFKNIWVSDNTYYNETITIKWPKIRALYGGEVNYQVFGSYDQSSWFLITTTTNPLLQEADIYKQKYTLDSIHDKIYFKVRAYNTVSETMSDVIQVNSCNEIGKITNFTYSTPNNYPYTKSKLLFQWNILSNLTDVSYVLQMSLNGDDWTTITTETNPVTFNNVNAFENYVLPNVSQTYFFKVVASNASGKALSDIIVLKASDFIGNLDILVNGKEYTGPVSVNTIDKVNLTWDNLSLDDEKATYVTRISTDMKTWKTAKQFDYANNLITEDLYSNQVLYFSFFYLTVYVTVEGKTTNGFTKSEVMVFYVNVDGLDPSYYINHIMNVQTSFINSMNIYK